MPVGLKTAGQGSTSTETKGEGEKHNRNTERVRLTGGQSRTDIKRVRGSAKDRAVAKDASTAQVRNEVVGGEREGELAKDPSLPVEEIKGLHPA